ncbi:MAG: peptide deformylase [Desulfobulbus propionicus]|nr:MAG: peptide deformylase [Desulfobulbus propionicus]
MAFRKIITYPHPVLRQKAEPVTEFDEALHALIQDMAETMYDAPGVGLAANQIGIARQIIVVDPSDHDQEPDLRVFINPVVTEGTGSQLDTEGCLSVIDCMASVKRFQKIHVTAQNADGTPLELDAEDRLARIIQHEIDHLNGILFIDHLSPLKRTLYKKKLKKIIRERQ